MQHDTALEPRLESSDWEIEEQFLNIANIRIRYLDHRALSSSDKLQLYSYYKQATAGDAECDVVPTDPKGMAKYLGWKNLQGMTRLEARKRYIATYLALYEKLHVNEEFLVVKALLLDQIIPTNHRRRWLAEQHAKHSLLSFKTPHYTTLYPDQLTPSMADEYTAHVGVRYKRTIYDRYLLDLQARKDPQPVSDQKFRRYLTKRHYSKLIVPLRTLDESAQAHYRDSFGSRDVERDMYIIDTTSIRALPIRPEDGYCIAPAVVCLVRDADTDELDPVAIAIENLDSVERFPPEVEFPDTLKSLAVVRPQDGLAWEMAKLYVLQGVDYTLGLGKHTVQHLALMTPIGLAFQDAAAEHGADGIVARILQQHTFLLLATNSFVLHSEYSVVWPDYKNQPYDAFCVSASVSAAGSAPGDREEFDDLGGAFNIAKLMFAGWKNHPYYKEVDDVELLANSHYDRQFPGYRSFLCDMKATVDGFIRGVWSQVAEDPEERAFVRTFKARLRERLPERSKLEKQLGAIDGDEWITDVVSYVICNSIEHAVDHRHAGLMAEAVHARLRKPIDFQDNNDDVEYVYAKIAKVNTMSDRSKYYLLNEITRKDVAVKTFGDLLLRGDGYFGQVEHRRKAELVALEKTFVTRMTRLCAEPDSADLEFCDIATSLQF